MTIKRDKTPNIESAGRGVVNGVTQTANQRFDPLDSPLVSLAAWIEADLARLESQFAEYITADSRNRDMRADR